MGKTAILLGATGLTGRLLLKMLLEDERYSRVKVFSRKTVDIKHTKFKEYLGDVIDIESFEKDFYGDEVFCCIGTTAKKTPDKNLYKSIDYGIPVKAARLCKKNKIHTFLVVSSIGANAKSNVFYSKTKGEMEEAVLTEKIPNTYILRPSLILGNRNEDRIGERMGKIFITMFQFLLIGKLKKYRPIEAEKIAKTMVTLANSKLAIQIVESDKIEEIAIR